MREARKKGVSMVAGTVLLVVLVFTVQIALFATVIKSNDAVQEAIRAEHDKAQEKFMLVSIETDETENYVHAVSVNNLGSIMVRIRAIYIDNEFLCDPSDKTINPSGAYANAKETSWILLPDSVKYEPESTLVLVTERGTKSIDSMKNLMLIEEEPPQQQLKYYLGPLWLNFDKFYYARIASNGSRISSWRPAWNVSKTDGMIEWNITVTNIDTRSITLNQFSGFTLVPNDQPSSRRPWYMDFSTPSLTMQIEANYTVSILFRWSTPKTGTTQPNTQSIYSTESRCRTFLTFFGTFLEKDGTTKPYGQTIPFEAVIVTKE